MSVFFDTNLLVYAQQAGWKGARAADLVARGGVVGARALNELVNVLRKKLRRDWPESEAVLNDVRDAVDDVAPQAGCVTLLSEELQDGRLFGGLTIRKPFWASPA